MVLVSCELSLFVEKLYFIWYIRVITGNSSGNKNTMVTFTDPGCLVLWYEAMHEICFRVRKLIWKCKAKQYHISWDVVSFFWGNQFIHETGHNKKNSSLPGSFDSNIYVLYLNKYFSYVYLTCKGSYCIWFSFLGYFWHGLLESRLIHHVKIKPRLCIICCRALLEFH